MITNSDEINIFGDKKTTNKSSKRIELSTNKVDVCGNVTKEQLQKMLKKDSKKEEITDKNKKYYLDRLDDEERKDKEHSKPETIIPESPKINIRTSSSPNDQISFDKWWNSYLAISNKISNNGYGVDYSNLDDNSPSGLVYYVEEFCNNIPLSQYPRILDIGAGNGGETKVLLDKGYNVTGITIGIDNIKFAKEKYNIDLLHMDMNHFDFLINSFDAIIMIQTFEHFLSSFIATIELWRVLRVGGLCYLDVPCPKDLPMWNLNHTNLLYADQIKNMFEMCGFKFVKQLSKNKEHRIRLIFEKLSISKIRNWNQLRFIHQLRNEA